MRNKTCPRCKWNLLESHPPPAISRRDNKTRICSQCGTREALEDSGLIDSWLDTPTNRPYWNTRSEVWLAQVERQHDKVKAEAEAMLADDGPYGRIS